MQTKRKTMIVTGAAQGIVAGVTNAFIERGYNIVANSLNITASAFAATDRLAVVRGDSGDPLPAREIASTAIETLGSIVLERTCGRLPSVDFSRDILAHQAKISPNRVLGLLTKNVNQPAGGDTFLSASRLASVQSALAAP
jgi:NAD(P)-dependent dehydrogenase (short-subunit alcohol dehydrogenase family)